jgi:hypothetical protein
VKSIQSLVLFGRGSWMYESNNNRPSREPLDLQIERNTKYLTNRVRNDHGQDSGPVGNKSEDRVD